MRSEARSVELEDAELDLVHGGAHIPRLPEVAEQPNVDFRVFDLLYGADLSERH